MHLHTDEQVICPVCCKAFRSKEILMDHMVTVHAKADKATVCPICARPSVNSHYIKKHVRLVHGNLDINPIKVSYNEYGKEFANPTYLQQHIKSCHELGQSTCELCNRSYKNPRALQRHFSYAHCGKKNYSVKNDDHKDSNPDSSDKSPNLSNEVPLNFSPLPSKPDYHQNVAGSGFCKHPSISTDFSTNQLSIARQFQWKQQ